MSKWSDDETDQPLIADDRNFYKVEKWTKDGSKVDHMLYAGSSLDKAQASLRGCGQASTTDQADYPAAIARAGTVARGTLTLVGRDLPPSSLIEGSTLGNSTHVTIPIIAREDPSDTLASTRAPPDPA